MICFALDAIHGREVLPLTFYKTVEAQRSSETCRVSHSRRESEAVFEWGLLEKPLHLACLSGMLVPGRHG